MTEHKLTFQDAEGLNVVGILSNPTSSLEKPIIILAHGFSSSKESVTFTTLQNTLNKHKISTFRFDFFGHGESDGKFADVTISKAINNLLHAITFLKEQGYTKIGLFGSSFGGISSIIAASKTVIRIHKYGLSKSIPIVS
mgnify:CR=1 FL=1